MDLFFGGDKVPSFDEKNYDKGILRICLNENVENPKDRQFKYVYTKNNEEVNDNDTLQRIYDLKIPYVWNYVWISNNPNTPIQVIGKDKNNKKQYLYNKEHKKLLVKHKFSNLNLLVKLMDKLYDVLNDCKKNAKNNPYLPLYLILSQ